MYNVTMGVVNKVLTLLKEEKTTEYRSGSVNVDTITFNFSGLEWDGLTKIAVFVTESGKVIDVPLIGNYCVVPADAYITSHTDLRDVDFYYDMVVGVYGQLIDENTNEITKILPTNLVRRKVRLGSYLPGVTPSDLPTAEQWQLYIDEVGRLASRAEASEAVCVELEGIIQDIYADIKDIQENVKSLESATNNYAQNTYNYANLANDYKNNAYESMENASNYASNAGNFANNSYQSALNASNYANNAKQYSENAQNYSNKALGYSSNAFNYSNNSYAHSMNASNYAMSASHYANNSSNFANLASNYANNARNSVNNASNYANNSSNSASLSSMYASNASSYMNAASNFSNLSKQYSDDANTTKNDIQNIYNEIWDISAARMFAAFDVNPKNGNLIMTTVQSMGNIGFSIDTNGNLVITLN